MSATRFLTWAAALSAMAGATRDLQDVNGSCP